MRYINSKNVLSGMANKRITLAQDVIKKNNCQLLVLSDKDSSHKWLLKGHVLEHSLIFIHATGKPTVLVSALEKFTSKEFNVVKPKNREEQKKTIDMFAKKAKRIAVSGSTCSLRMQNVLGVDKKYVDVESELLNLRAIKSNNEIELLLMANDLTVKCFEELVSNWHKFSHENDAIRFIKQFALLHDVGLSFDPIVASGANASIPHHKDFTKLNKGFCVIDFGFCVGGYHADMTRTIYIGKPSVSEILLYNRLLEIQEAAVALVKLGVKCSDLHNYVVKMLGEKDSKLFIHSLGHGVGLDIHELPNVSAKSDAVLRAGMAITIEPGIYDSKSKNKFGIRIEDSVIVDKKGHINLTKKASKELICVK